MKIIKFFDKLEDAVRRYLSRMPIVYSLIGGICVVLFWRGVWHTADMLLAGDTWSSIGDEAVNILYTRGITSFIFYEPVNFVFVVLVLLLIGLFISVFIGDQIIISGIRGEKKIVEQTEEDIEEEGAILKKNDARMKKIEESLETIKGALRK